MTANIFCDQAARCPSQALDKRLQLMPEPNRRRPDLLPAIVLLAIVGAVGAGLWLFPYVQTALQHRDCVSVGRTDCG
jgi:hypothetical protein